MLAVAVHPVVDAFIGEIHDHVTIGHGRTDPVRQGMAALTGDHGYPPRLGVAVGGSPLRQRENPAQDVLGNSLCSEAADRSSVTNHLLERIQPVVLHHSFVAPVHCHADAADAAKKRLITHATNS